MSDADTDFTRKVQGFASEVLALLSLIELQHAEVTIEISGNRAVVELMGRDPQQRSVPFRVAGEWSAGLSVRFGCRPDSSGRYLAVTQSAFAVWSTAERNPLFRLEYDENARTRPSCHWQVHAERGALSHLLTVAGHERPSLLSGLHIPVGGTRARPGLEDFLQFVIVELGAAPAGGWQAVLEHSRAQWRRRQVAALVRDVPGEAVRALSELGYKIELPSGGEAPVRDAILKAW